MFLAKTMKYLTCNKEYLTLKKSPSCVVLGAVKIV